MRFFRLTKSGDNFKGSAIHQRPLDAYRKARVRIPRQTGHLK
jgi:hypothetical protein